MGSRSASPEDSTTSAPLRADAFVTESADNILVGLVVRPHGLRGEVKIEVFSDVDDRFAPGAELLLTTRTASGATAAVRVASFRPVRGGGVIRLLGCDDREAAEGLRGARLEVAPAQVPPAPEGLYYHFELVGCRCVDRELGDLGEVEAVVEDGGGVLLEVTDGRRTVPVPFVEAFLEAVDIAGRRIRLRLPPGLIESCASRS